MLKQTLFAAALVATASSSARAEDPAPSDGFVLSRGKLALDAAVEIDLSSGRAFEPVSISPDLWYGATDDLTVGLVHSGTGATGFLGALGDSLCITGESHGCGHVYNNAGLAGRYRIARPWAVDAGLYVTSFADPFQLAAKLGVDGRWLFGKVSVELRPSIFVGLTNRDAGSKEALFVPVTASYLVAPKVDLAVQAGLAIPFTHTSDTWTAPLSIAARFAATARLGIGLAFTLPTLIGGTSTADIRTLTLGGSYAF